MTLEAKLGSYFKPETIKSGADLFAKNAVFLSLSSDAQIQSLVKAGTGARVRFLAPDITSPGFNATCSCATGKKGSVCRHIWATLLKVQKDYPDFLENRKSIQVVLASASAPPSPRTEAYKAKQNEFKKTQYEKQKQYAKQKRAEQKASKKAESKKRNQTSYSPNFSPEVQSAFKYFAENGFPLESDLNLESLRTVKKKLSRIFHPDLGGSHTEITVLNRQIDILCNYLEKTK